MIEYWTAFTIGLLGSFHCIGMCGPVVMALPLNIAEKRQVLFQSLLYHLGRITTYSLMGLFMGMMGWGIVIAGYQKIFSVTLGVVLIASVLFSLSFEKMFYNIHWVRRYLNLLKNRLGKLLRIKSNSSAFKVGLLNGLLPCGLVYIALASSVAVGGILEGGLYMAAFGSGTLPMMIGVMAIGNIHRHYFSRLQKLIPVGLVFFGALLIYRGYMLHIPADLTFWEMTNFQIMCH